MSSNGNQSSDLRTDQLAPHSVEAEEAVLGAILISEDALYEVIDLLAEDDFFIVRHAWVYEAMRTIQERHDPIDFLTVSNELEQRGRLAECGGAAYLLSLVNKTPSTLNAEGYARIVANMATRRRLIDSASFIARAAHSEETDIHAVLASSEESLFAVTDRQDDYHMATAHEMASQDWDTTSKAARGLIPPGLMTGLIDYDTLSGGCRDGELITIAARPGMGKSAWIQTVIAYQCQTLKARVGLCSLEMDRAEVTRRFIAALSDIPYLRLKSGKLSPDEWARYTVANQIYDQWFLVIDDTPTLTPLQLRKKARQMVYRHGINILFIDYLQLMTGGKGFKGKDRVAEVDYISRYQKLIAREFDIPVVSAAQLSREVEKRSDKRPLLSDLRESGGIEQNSDVVMFIYRDEYYNPDTPKKGVAELHISKHRNGPTGMVETWFFSEKMQFASAEKHSIDLNA